MRVGASYYPELYPPEVWQHDLELGRELGLSVLRCGEFAWQYLEPQPGVFQPDWVLKFLDLAHELGYQVIWCTPSATPPPSFFHEYAELGATAADGTPMPVGVRRNYTPAHGQYRERCAQLAFQLGRALKAHPALVGWQIDNELAGDGFTCWGGRPTRESFQAYLRLHFGTLENLNRRLGGGVWSQVYINWGDIPIPGPGAAGSFPPGLRLEFRRYRSWIWFQFYQAQYNALKAAGVPQPITSNFYNLTWHIPFDLWQWRSALDAMGVSHYVEDENFTRFQYGLLRGVGGPQRPLWVLEQKAGQQAAQNLYPDDTTARLTRHLRLTAEAGAEYAIYWHLRQHSYGCELLHGAVIGHDGGKGRIARAVEQAIAATRQVRAQPERRDLGLYFSFQQQWSRETRGGTPQWDYRTEVEENYFAALPGCRIIGPDDLRDPELKTIVLPLMELDEGLDDQLQERARGGATVVISACHGRFDYYNAARRQLPLAGWKPVLPELPDWELLALAEPFNSAEGYAGRLFYAWPYGRIELQPGSAPAWREFPLGAGRVVVLLSSFAAPELRQIFDQLGVN